MLAPTCVDRSFPLWSEHRDGNRLGVLIEYEDRGGAKEDLPDCCLNLKLFVLSQLASMLMLLLLFSHGNPVCIVLAR